jgi:thiol-disulfide isomerase/thioredoxin
MGAAPAMAFPAQSLAHCPRRRKFILAATGVALPGLAAAQPSPGYEVARWRTAVPPLQSLNRLPLTDTAGKTWQLAELAGRAVLLNFWASWCEPCRAEMPSLQRLAAQHGAGKLVVLAINFKEPATRAIQFATQHGVTLPVLLDSQGQLASSWGVRIFPTTLMLDRRGQPTHRVTGEIDWTGAAASGLVDALLRD